MTWSSAPYLWSRRDLTLGRRADPTKESAGCYFAEVSAGFPDLVVPDLVVLDPVLVGSATIRKGRAEGVSLIRVQSGGVVRWDCRLTTCSNTIGAGITFFETRDVSRETLRPSYSWNRNLSRRGFRQTCSTQNSHTRQTDQ